MHNVRSWTIPNISEQQLDIFKNSNPKTLLIHARIIPWNNGHGMQLIPKDLKEHKQPIRNPTTKLIRTLHKINNPPNPRINKETLQ